jgi:peroxiredoxin-like protein
MAQIHEYPVHVDWSGGREGNGSAVPAHSGTTFQLAVGKEFQGTGEGTNPEEMLTAAITSCYSMTFGIIAANRKIPVKSLSVDATGQVEQNGASFTYRSITVRPSIVLEAGATPEQVALATDMAHKADSYCIITNAVRGKVEIAVEPTVTVG